MTIIIGEFAHDPIVFFYKKRHCWQGSLAALYMSKSMIIIIVVLWVLCTLYYTLARAYGYPYAQPAMAGSWIMSGVLLVCVILFIRRHSRK